MKNESKDEMFKRIAEKRVQNIITSLRSLSQLSNRKIYNWNNDQLEKIWKAIETEIDSCKKSFENPDLDVFKL